MRKATCLGLLAASLALATDFRAELEALLTAEADRFWLARTRRIEALQTRADLEDYQRALRQKALRLIGGLPEEKTPLRARVTGHFERPGYRVEKVIFESQPGYRVTANLYLPTNRKGPFPAVLGVAGHSNNGKASATYQHAFVGMVRRGMAVFAYDPPGQGERIEYSDVLTGRSRVGPGVNEHQMAGVPGLLTGQTLARYFVWDGIRAVDYLSARPEIDASRLAVAGNSGGGTQAAYLAVFEPRLKAIVSSCYMTRWRELWSGPGPQDAEQIWPGFLSEGLDFSDFALAAAPRPYLITSAIRDYFPISGARATYTELRRLFDLWGKENQVGFFEHDDTHGWSKPRREAAYRWLTKWFFGAEETSLEADFQQEEEGELWVSPGGLAGGRTTRELFLESLARSRRPAFDREQLRKALAWQDPVPAQEQGDDLVVSPGLRIAREWRPALRPRGVVILASEGPESGETEELVSSGFSVLRVYPRGSGPGYGRSGASGYGLSYQLAARHWLIGRSLPVEQARDLVSVYRYLQQRMPALPVRLYARGRLGVAGLLAAVLEPSLSKTLIENALPSWTSLLETAVHEGSETVLIPGILKVVDLPDLVQYVGPGRVLVVNPTLPSGRLDRQRLVTPGYALRGEGWPLSRTIGSFFQP